MGVLVGSVTEETEMLVGFLMLYIELAGLILTGGYAISSLFVSDIIPQSVSPEHALMLSMQ
jgi:hypothetical protein